jgi:hypothetical protein
VVETPRAAGADWANTMGTDAMDIDATSAKAKRKHADGGTRRLMRSFTALLPDLKWARKPSMRLAKHSLLKLVFCGGVNQERSISMHWHRQITHAIYLSSSALIQRSESSSGYAARVVSSLVEAKLHRSVARGAAGSREHKRRRGQPGSLPAGAHSC